MKQALIREKPPLWAAVLVASLCIGGMAALRLVILPNYIIPIGYGVPIILIAWFRDRRVLWATFACFLAR